MHADAAVIDRIHSTIDEIEHTEHIKILHCVESGSRAWGFSSPDSDYDVRFIYIREPEFYLRLDKTRDVIEWQLDDIYDINGWDIKKALQLLHNSNPTLFEWNNSPIVYKTTPEWQCLSSLIGEYFCSKSGLHHYLSTAKSNYREYLRTDMVRLKKYFYVIRPLLACRWILANKCAPPMLFSELAEAELPADLISPINKLLDMKINSPEITECPRVDAINQYIEREFELISEEIVKYQCIENKSWQPLNDTFLRLIDSYNVSYRK